MYDLTELKVKREVFEKVLLCGCGFNNYTEAVWSNPVKFPELYSPGDILTYQDPRTSPRGANRLFICKMREDKLKKAIEDLNWKIKFLEYKPLKWHRKLFLRFICLFKKDSINLELLK